jgi:hypothetical protein
MRIVFGQPKAPVAPLGGLLQRQCACGNHADGSECAEGSKKKRTLERAARDSGGTGRQGVSTEGRRLYNGASLAFGFGGRYRAFFVADFNGIRASGYSLPPYCATGSAAPFRYSADIDNGGDSATLAHELGHILINSGAHPVGTVMGSRPAAPAMKRPRFTDPQCTTLHSNA